MKLGKDIDLSSGQKSVGGGGAGLLISFIMKDSHTPTHSHTQEVNNKSVDDVDDVASAQLRPYIFSLVCRTVSVVDVYIYLIYIYSIYITLSL